MLLLSIRFLSAGIKGAADTITVKSGGISSIPTQYVPKEPEEFRERVTEFAKNKEYYTKFYNIVKKFYQELAGTIDAFEVCRCGNKCILFRYCSRRRNRV